MKICKSIAGSTVLTKRDITHSIKCIKCDHVSHKGIRDKFRLCERSRAEHFLDAVKFRQDAVSMRLAGIDTVESLIAADVYAHEACMRAYLREYENALTQCVICQRKCFRVGYHDN